MAAFLSQDIETLDLEDVSRIFTLQSEATIAGSSTVTEDEGFMRWTDESVKLFISLYHEHEHKFADVNFKNRSVWEAIAKAMKQKNYHPSATQCANKWKQLKKSFADVEDNKRATRRGAKTYKYYQELGEILSCKPGVNPVSTASSSGKGEITDSEPATAVATCGTEGKETPSRPAKKRKRRDSGHPKPRADEISNLLKDSKEEKKAREERQFAAYTGKFVSHTPKFYAPILA